MYWKWNNNNMPIKITSMPKQAKKEIEISVGVLDFPQKYSLFNHFPAPFTPHDYHLKFFIPFYHYHAQCYLFRRWTNCFFRSNYVIIMEYYRNCSNSFSTLMSLVFILVRKLLYTMTFIHDSCLWKKNPFIFYSYSSSVDKLFVLRIGNIMSLACDH